MKMVLGSASTGRRRLLAEMGHEFEVIPADIDEKAVRHDDPAALVSALAEAKSLALRQRLKEPCILITSDQVVTSGGRILEKPADEAEAREFIRRAGDEPSATVTAVMAVNTATGRTAAGIDTVRIWIDPIPPGVADRVICKGEVYYCAGGFDVSDPDIKPYIRKIDGDLDSVIGLPKKLTQRLIDEVTA